METDIKETLEYALLPLIKSMVDYPDEVKISIQKSEYQTVFIHITAMKGDVGKVIGREGRHATAIRTLVSAIGSKLKYRTLVEINPE